MFKNILKSDFHRVVRLRGMWIALIITAAIAFQFFFSTYRRLSNIPNPQFLEEANIFYEYLQMNTAESFFSFFLPIAVILSVGSIFLEERTTNFLDFSLTRMSGNYYIVKKVLSLSLISFIIILLHHIVAFIIGVLHFSAQQPNLVTWARNWRPSYATELFFSNVWIFMVIIFVNAAMMGIFISTLCVLGALLTKNKYIALTIPLLVFYGGSALMMLAYELSGRMETLRFLFEFSPATMAGGYISHNHYVFGISLYWLLLSILVTVIIYVVFKWQLNKGKLI